MKLNQTTDHAIRIVLLLSKCDMLPSSTIAEKLGLSRRYLFHITSQLRDAGIVSVTKGAVGGYTLNVQPHEITVHDIIVLMEGRFSIPEHCEATYSDGLGALYAFSRDFFEGYTKLLSFNILATYTHADILKLMQNYVIDTKMGLLC